MLSVAAAVPAFILAASWFLATVAIRGRAHALGFSGATIGDLSWWVMVGALAGARLVYVVGHWPFFLPYPQDILLTLWHGLSFYGGLTGAIVVGVWYACRQGLAPLALANAVAPALPLGVALGRLGFVAYGAWPFVPFAAAVGLASGQVADLLEALLCLGLFVTISHRAGRTKASPFLLALAGYGLIRAMADLLRPGAVGLWPLSDQSVALALTVVGFAALALPGARQPVAAQPLARRSGGGS